MKYDHSAIADFRTAGHTWHEIAGRLGGDAKQLRQAHSRWCQRQQNGDAVETHEGGIVVQKWLRTEVGTIHVKNAGQPESVADAQLAAFEDLFERGADMRARVTPPPMRIETGDALAVLSLYDAHFGMLVDGDEVESPDSQDLKIISKAFRQVGDNLIAMSRIYGVDRYLIPLGHDFSHVNQYDGKALTTRSGTPQDVDSRLWKIHQAVCEASVHLIDTARSTGLPVDVVMVPGNHDPDENYKLGAFLQAWYRNDPGVTVTNTPTMHKYYGWGANAFMLTHGEHYMKRAAAGNPILTFATECPPDIWAMGHRGGRYILSGHLHARRAGQYTPTSDVTEERGIVTYVLPGLTATDDWHYRSGYRHSRAATLQVFRRTGGLIGLHEVTP